MGGKVSKDLFYTEINKLNEKKVCLEKDVQSLAEKLNTYQDAVNQYKTTQTTQLTIHQDDLKLLKEEIRKYNDRFEKGTEISGNLQTQMKQQLATLEKTITGIFDEQKRLHERVKEDRLSSDNKFREQQELQEKQQKINQKEGDKQRDLMKGQLETLTNTVNAFVEDQGEERNANKMKMNQFQGNLELVVNQQEELNQRLEKDRLSADKKFEEQNKAIQAAQEKAEKNRMAMMEEGKEQRNMMQVQLNTLDSTVTAVMDDNKEERNKVTKNIEVMSKGLDILNESHKELKDRVERDRETADNKFEIQQQQIKSDQQISERKFQEQQEAIRKLGEESDINRQASDRKFEEQSGAIKNMLSCLVHTMNNQDKHHTYLEGLMKAVGSTENHAVVGELSKSNVDTGIHQTIT